MIALLDRERLAKLLGMLGSEHDGEVVTAARRADALVRTAGLTWHDVVAANGAQPHTPDEPLKAAGANHSPEQP